jgi:hypothetical protein
MAMDLDDTAARLSEALRALPDPATDPSAARRLFRRRVRRSIVRRRLAVAALAATLAIFAVLVFHNPTSADIRMLPAKQLRSGLPVGTLSGHVPYREPNGRLLTATLWLVVHADGTGTYLLHDMAVTWPVRYVGNTPGHVQLKREAQFCHTDDNELVLDFVVDDGSVMITHAAAGACSAWPKVGNADLRNVVLHRTSKQPPLRDSS